MNKQTKKYVKIGSIILIILLLLFTIKVPVATPLNAVAPVGTSGSSSGGGSSGSSSSAPTNTDTPLIFIPLSWLGFNIPTVDIPSFPTIPVFTFPVPEGSILKSNGDSCNSNAQCSSNYCNIGNMAIGKCADNPGRTSLLPTIRTTTTESECSRSTDCNKCANPAYDTCSDGKCICAAPVEEIVTRTTTPECTRNSQCSKCANAAYDVCVDGTCGCTAPVIVPTETRTITPECTRSSECNKCANADYDKCSNNVCICEAPTISR